MLYQGAVKFLRQAAAEMQSGNHEAKARSMNKAAAIVEELNITLDMKRTAARSPRTSAACTCS